MRLLWLTLSLGSALLVGIAAASLQTVGIAPIGLLSIVAGMALGASLFAIAQLCDFRPAPRTTTIVLFALMAIAMQHVWLYRDYTRKWHEVTNGRPEITLLRSESSPKPINEYLADELSTRRLILWSADLLFVAICAVLAFRFVERNIK